MADIILTKGHRRTTVHWASEKGFHWICENIRDAFVITIDSGLTDDMEDTLKQYGLDVEVK